MKNCIISACEQGSEEWFELRNGRITASRASKLLLKSGNISEAQMDTLAKHLAADEFAYNEPKFKTEWTERGHELESEAFDVASFATGIKFAKAGFVLNRELNIGCSPDGLAQDMSCGLEIKCPKATTHLQYLKDAVVPSEYVAQVQFSMWCTGIPKWIFCSYYPGVKPLIVGVEPDLELHEKFAKMVIHVYHLKKVYLEFVE